MISTPLGYLDFTVEDNALTSLSLSVHSTMKTSEEPLHLLLSQELAEYFTGKRSSFSIPLHINTGTDLQKKVWSALRQIPYGTVITYSDLAHKVGYPRAIRAVATAVGKNPIPIIIPCHRVIGKNSLWKFGWGRDWKEFLLTCEGTTLHS